MGLYSQIKGGYTTGIVQNPIKSVKSHKIDNKSGFGREHFSPIFLAEGNLVKRGRCHTLRTNHLKNKTIFVI